MRLGTKRPWHPGALLVMLGMLAAAGCGDSGDDPAGAGQPTPGVDQSAAPADLVAIGQVAQPEALAELGIALERPAGDATLISSHYAVELAGVAVLTELDYDQLRALNLHRTFPEAEAAPLRAAPGQEFLVAYLIEPESADVVLGGDSAEVIVDREPRPLDRVPHSDEAILVSVPAGSDAILAITDAGETKTLSLRTGPLAAAGGQDHPADNLEGGNAQLEEGVAISGVSPAGQADGLQISVSLEPYGHLDGEGWADDGHMWLEIEFGLSLAGLTAERAELRLDLAESLTITGEDGTRVPVPGDVVEPTVLPGGALATAQWSGVVQVPDSLRAFDVTYATHGTFTSPEGQELSFTNVPRTPTATIELTER